MPLIKSVCVYCGSSASGAPIHYDTARDVGHLMAKAGIAVVYGGGRVGMMGTVADATLAAGGKVIGFIPEHLHEAEIAHKGITELHIVPSMHIRKRQMFERSDAFIILPGGLGTLDETFEIITWRQLHLHDKPIFIFDIDGYWQPLIKLLDAVIEGHYASAATRRLYRIVSSSAELMAHLLQEETVPGRPAQTQRL
ncbi:MAG: TIGR00730 family Rossman fold protein [Alphaproteobacteria bacterium]